MMTASRILALMLGTACIIYLVQAEPDEDSISVRSLREGEMANINQNKEIGASAIREERMEIIHRLRRDEPKKKKRKTQDEGEKKGRDEGKKKKDDAQKKPKKKKDDAKKKPEKKNYDAQKKKYERKSDESPKKPKKIMKKKKTPQSKGLKNDRRKEEKSKKQRKPGRSGKKKRPDGKRKKTNGKKGGLKSARPRNKGGRKNVRKGNNSAKKGEKTKKGGKKNDDGDRKKTNSQKQVNRKEAKKIKTAKKTKTPNEKPRQLTNTKFAVEASSAQCDDTFNLNYGESALLYSINDRSKLKCKQYFESPAGTTIDLSCMTFNMNSRGCGRERLFVFPGSGGRKKSKFCTSNPPSMTTPDNNLEIRYIRKAFRGKDCSGGYLCMATVIGDNPNTTPEPSTTPVNDAESPTAKATTTEPTTTPPTTTEPTTTQPTTTEPITTQPTTTPPTTTEPTTTPPTTTEPTTTQPTTTPPTTTEPTTTPPTTTQTTTTPPTTTEPTTTPPTTTMTTTTPPTTTQTTTTPPTTTQTTTTPPTTTQTITTPPTTTQTTTTPPTTTQTTTTTPTTSASTSASQGPAVTRLYCNDDCGQSTVTVPRIVGGEEATIHEYPWQVLLTVTALAFPNGATCGASIIKKGWILTAAHCFVDPNTVALYPGLGLKVTVAEHDTDNASETEEIDITPTGNVLFVHPDYKQADRNSEEHDIALVYLGGTLTFGSGIKPICMPVESDYTPEKEVVVTGWGVTQWQGDQPPKLQEVALNLKSQADCETLNNNAPATYAISGNMVCALGPNKDACQGDSGGPLVTQSADGRWVQLGVVSFGYQCAVTNVPGFYTKVSNYIPWITQTTGNTDC